MRSHENFFFVIYRRTRFGNKNNAPQRLPALPTLFLFTLEKVSETKFPTWRCNFAMRFNRKCDAKLKYFTWTRAMKIFWVNLNERKHKLSRSELTLKGRWESKSFKLHFHFNLKAIKRNSLIWVHLHNFRSPNRNIYSITCHNLPHQEQWKTSAELPIRAWLICAKEFSAMNINKFLQINKTNPLLIETSKDRHNSLSVAMSLFIHSDEKKLRLRLYDDLLFYLNLFF